MSANRGVFAVAILTLALGIGANTAMFSVMRAVLLRPLPFPDSERLATIYAEIPHLNISGAFVEYNTFVEWWRPRNRVFESMAAYSPASAILDTGAEPQRIHTLRVSASYLSMIGVKPALGRDFLPEEDRPGARPAVILSDGLWKRRFGAQRDVLGRSILLDKNPHTIVGVMPADFDLDPADVYLPIAHSGARVHGMPSVGVHARLKRGVSLAAAQADIDKLCRGWIAQYHYPADWGARIWNLHDHMVRTVRSSVMVMAAAVALVLLIACANVANLLLVRSGVRQREIAIRTALGAGRMRIVRQLLTESAVLGTIAAMLGVLLAWAATRAMIAADIPVPFSKKVTLDAAVLGFTVGATLLTTILFGLAPVLAALDPRIAEQLKEGGRAAGESVRGGHLRSVLVIGEVALAVLLVIGAALTMRSLSRLLAVNPGFNPESVLTADIALPDAGYADPSRRAAFYSDLLQRINASPGVIRAGMVSDLPFGGSKSGSDVRIEGAPPPNAGDRLIAFTRTVDAGFFPTMQARLLRGRFFTAADASGPLVAIINDAMARRCWPGQDALGRHFAPGSESGSAPAWFTVIGVIADMRNTSLADPPDLEYYFPYVRYPQSHMSLAVRTALDPPRLASAIREAVRQLDRELPVSEIGTLTRTIGHSTGERRFSATLLAGFALLALVLATVGIYGVVAYSVTRRTHEIGVRVALGASPRRITAGVVGRALIWGTAGVALGLAAGLLSTRLLRSILFGVSATDPPIFAAAAIFLLAVCAGAAYLPARRAAQIDPMAALHHE